MAEKTRKLKLGLDRRISLSGSQSLNMCHLDRIYLLESWEIYDIRPSNHS
jgi:hypothetical protein